MTDQEFEIIYSSIRARLVAMVRQFSKAASMTMEEDDIVQEAFIVLWQLSEKGYPVRNPEALLVRITKNICSGLYRRQKNKVHVPLEDSIPSDGSVWARINAEDEDKIRQVLYGTLTKTEREYMTLKTGEDMSLDEIAEVTGKSKPGIKTALSKARKKMMEAFKNYE